MALLTIYWCLDLVIFSITLIIGAYMYMTRNFLYWKKRGVMEVTPTPFTGNFGDCLLMRKSPGEVIKYLYDQAVNLPYMGFYIFDRPFFMPRDPELIKRIVVRDFNYFTDRFATAQDGLGGPSVFFVDNPGWKIVRNKLTPTMTSGKLKKMFELMLDVGKNLTTYFNSLNLGADGEIMEVKQICANFATDIIGSTAFGLNVNCLNDPDSIFRKKSEAIFELDTWRSIEFTALFFAPQFVKPLRLRFMTEESANFLRKIFWDGAAQRERTGIRRNDLIDRMMDLKKSEADSPDKNIFEFDGDGLVAQAGAFFSAGFETVSSTLSFMLYELALAPYVQTKLRQELRDALKNNNGEITYDLIKNLPYTDMVLSETLRKYPPLPFVDRTTIADYKIPDSDLVLEKGTPIYISLLGLHYDPEYFPNPNVFDPERFNEENTINRKFCIHMPFGEGPRNCIGMRFAQIEIKLATMHMLTQLEFLPCEKTMIPMTFDPKAFLRPKGLGIHLRIRKLTNVDS